MGERAEPMQWIVARHRENSGERDEEPGDPDTLGLEPPRRRAGQSPRLCAYIVIRLVLSKTHFRPHPR